MNDVLTDVLQSIWQSVLAKEVSFVEPASPDETFPDGLTASIQISGAWSGAIVASFPPALARSLAAKMLEVDPDAASSEDLSDTLGEIVNMIGGNMKAMLPSPSRLSLPWVTTGHDVHLSFPHCTTKAGARFVCDGESIVVCVIQLAVDEVGGASVSAE